MEKMKTKAVHHATRERMDLIVARLVLLEHKYGNKQYPIFSVSPELMETLGSPWKQSVAVKLLGKSISFITLSTRVEAMWKPNRDFDVLDLGYDYFLVRFDDHDDWENSLMGGPW